MSARRLPPPPRAPLPFSLPTFTGTRLANGVAVRSARWGRRPTVAVAVLFPGAGSAADPPAREGMAEITGDTFLGGTRRRNARELGEALDDLAAILEVSTGSDSSVARLFVLEKDLDEGLALLAEVLTESTFPEDEFEKNRRRQIDVLAEQRSEPDFLARERLLDRLYPGHPYGRLTATEKGLASLSQGDVAAFAASRFSLANATLILAGAADPDALLYAAERAFGGLPAGVLSPPAAVPPPPAIPGFSIHLVNRPGSVQTNLLFARPALARRNPRFTTALVANQSLGGGASSRLFHVLREERSLTYGAYSSVSARVAGGQFGASIDCRTEVTREACCGTLRPDPRLRLGGADGRGARPLAEISSGQLSHSARDPGRRRPGRDHEAPPRTARRRVGHVAGPRQRRVARRGVPDRAGILRPGDRNPGRRRRRETDPARPGVVRGNDALGRGRPTIVTGAAPIPP